MALGPRGEQYAQEVVMVRTNKKDNAVNESPGKEIAALNEIARATMSSLDFEQVLLLVRTRLAGLLGAEEILIFAPESDNMQVLRPGDEIVAPLVRVPLTQKGVGTVALKDEPILLPGVGVAAGGGRTREIR